MKTKRVLCLLLVMLMAFTIVFPASIYADDEIFEEIVYDEYVEPTFDEWIIYDTEEQLAEETEFYDEIYNEETFAPEDTYFEEEEYAVYDNDPSFEDELAAENFMLEDAAVFETGSSPVITEEPEDAYGLVGQTVSFTVAAEGEELSYQWMVNSGSGFRPTTAAGYDSPTFSFKIASSKYYNYSWKCVVSNAAGEVTSKEVTAL